jgi:hypothetical protein
LVVTRCRKVASPASPRNVGNARNTCRKHLLEQVLAVRDRTQHPGQPQPDPVDVSSVQRGEGGAVDGIGVDRRWPGRDGCHDGHVSLDGATGHKYAQPGDTFGGPKLLGEQVVTPRAVWLAIPALMMVGAYLMASSLRMLKVGTAESKAITVFLIVNILSGYLLGFAQLMPEYLVWMPSAWIVVFLVWGALAEEARDLRPPPLFPAE